LKEGKNVETGVTMAFSTPRKLIPKVRIKSILDNFHEALLRKTVLNLYHTEKERPTLKKFSDNRKFIVERHDIRSLRVKYLRAIRAYREETMLQNTNKWFSTNLLYLNLKKTNFVQFSTKQTKNTLGSIAYEENYITNVNSTSFLGLILDDTLTWKAHTDQLCSKFQSACYILRTLTPLLTQQNMKIICFSYFHSIMMYGVIFWGNSAGRNSVFKLQKKAIRLITNSNSRTSCRGLFKKLGILPLQSQYILSLAIYVSKNMELFTLNVDIHTKNTRNKFNLFLPQSRLTKYQKGAYFAGIKIFNHLPENIKKKNSNNTNKFKNELKKFLLLGSFYTIEEFYGWTSERKLYASYL
jgi:hypothetical protein